MKPEMPNENKKIPFLHELPAEFRHTVPDLKINVFVYSGQAAERFVMIDMAKYTVGQRIKDSLELKEIRPDSLVVEYNNQTFRIQRP
jgi:general secretion pathway protein B